MPLAEGHTTCNREDSNIKSTALDAINYKLGNLDPCKFFSLLLCQDVALSLVCPRP